MPKISMTFDDEEIDEFKRMINYSDLAVALNEIYNKTRNQLKHGEPNRDRDVLEEVKSIASSLVDYC